jgi:hypothetical protein
VNDRARDLIAALGMRPHPEGGHYAEVFRSPRHVAPTDGRPERPGLSTIYFLLQTGERSAWHRLESDEIWLHFEGAPVRLWTFDAPRSEVRSRLLGPLAADTEPQRVVTAGLWQAAEPLGEYALTGAAVGPGFDFADFRMLAADPAAREALRRSAPDLLRLA